MRIEDTDVARSDQDVVDAILNGLKWLGLDWDEEPVFQSKRFEVYKEFAEKLVKAEKAYKCYCTQERLKEIREKAQREKGEYKYDRACLKLTESELKTCERDELPFVIRLKVREGRTSFHDQVYSEIEFDNSQIDDFVILRSDGHPTYHLAVVVDDYEMQISHVIRGDDHLSNTPKHILLYEAFDWNCPVFAHVPLILGPDRQRLSKRHGATAVGEYKNAGYLTDAFVNFLSLLGWSSGDDREIFTCDELIKAFSLQGIMKKSAVFDERKLQWMNGQYLMAMDEENLLDLVLPDLLEDGLVTKKYSDENRAYLLKIVSLLKPRLKRVSEFPTMARYFFRDPVTYDEKGTKKHWKDTQLNDKFIQLIYVLMPIKEFTTDTIENAMKKLAEDLDINAAKIIHPVRIAITGYSVSPGMFEVMEILGKETSIRRIKRAVEYLQNSPWKA